MRIHNHHDHDVFKRHYHHHGDFRRHYHPRYGVFIGLAIILFGILALLNSFGVIIVGNPWSYWPVILIIIGFGSLLYRRFFSAICLFAIGGFFLAKNFMPGFPVSIWPIIIILVGIKIVVDVFHKPFWHRFREQNVNAVTDDNFDISSRFSDYFYTIDSKNLKGGKINVTMGALRVDLKSADFKEDSLTINVSVLMGDLHLIIPDEWKVEIKGTNFLGDYKDHTFYNSNADNSHGKLLIIKGSVTMGNLNILN